MQVYIPYENRNVDFEAYLLKVLEYHFRETPYWQKQLSQRLIEKVVCNSIDETLYNLLRLEVDQNLLRTRWMDFKPKGLTKAKCSFSSGTTGPQKYCIWSEDYIKRLANYISHYVGKQVKIKHAIIQGPNNVYKDFNELAINILGGLPYFVGLRVEGTKPLLEKAVEKGPQEIIRVFKEYFGPEIEKTKRFLEYDANINFMRSAWMMLAFFEQFFGHKRNVDTVMVSGLGYAPSNHQLLQQKFKTVIPSYGYFAFGDALGKYTNGNLDYHPAFPYAIFTVINEKGEIVKYGEEGNPLFVIARPDLFLVLKESNEYAIRTQPKEEFPWDGIRNPRRNV